MINFSDCLKTATNFCAGLSTPASNDDSPTLESATGGVRNQVQALLGAILRSKTPSGSPVKTVGLTSCYRQEGVSSIAALLSQLGAVQRNVLLVDANVGNPTIDLRFGIHPEPGLLQALSGDWQVRDCIQQTASGLSLLPSGSASDPSSSLLVGSRLPSLLGILSARYELVILDLPAIDGDASAFELCAYVDGLVMVIEAERVHWQAGLRTISRLRKTNTRILGAVLNKRRDYIPDWLYRVL